MASVKRALDFHNDEEVIAEIERLRTDGYTKHKNWNLSQICQHLTITMTGGMEGFGFRMPWILRATVMKWLFQNALKKRRLPSGPTVKPLLPTTAGDNDDDTVIDECIATLKKAAAFAGPIKDYPLLNDVDVEDWKQFMWLHAAHHLGFLQPAKDSP